MVVNEIGRGSDDVEAGWERQSAMYEREGLE